MKKEMVCYAFLDGEHDDGMLLKEVIGTLDCKAGVEYGTDWRGMLTTNVYPLSLGEAESLLEWAMENRVKINIGRYDEADEENWREIIAQSDEESVA